MFLKWAPKIKNGQKPQSIVKKQDGFVEICESLAAVKTSTPSLRPGICRREC